MADFAPIVVDFTANAAGAITGINELIASLERLGEVAATVTAGVDEAMAGLRASAASVATVGESVAAAGEGMASMGAEAEAMGAAVTAGADEAAVSMAKVGEAAKASAVSVEEAAAGTKAAAAESGAAAEGMGAKFLGLNEIGSKIKAVLPLSLAAVGFEAVKMATSFQKSTTQLVTSAGESTKAIGQVRSGMLDMAGSVGVKANDLSKAMYYVEAAGYHAADGLTVLKAAAQGAAAEGADTTTVAQALTDVLVDYHLKASDAADITSKMIEAVAHGKTNLQDFAGSFASIVPAASAAGISFDDVGAALANMTNHGFTAQRASQNLAQALRSLLNPTNKMYGAFTQYGVSADVLKAKLHGPNGLTDAMEYLSQAASKAGKEGTPEFAAALKELMGTAPGANAALATVGANFKATSDTITAMGHATADAKGRVQGFALVQQTLGFQLKQIRAGFDSVMIKLGDGLIPVLSKAITLVEKGASPAFHGLASALSGISSGFSGKAGQAPADAGAMQRHHGDAYQPPPLTAWQKVGQVLRGAAEDFKRFGEDVAKAFRNLAQAAGPTLKLLGSTLLAALRGVASILANVVGPALVKVSGFMDHHKTVIRDLIAVALIPLALRLTALAIVKPIGAVAKLAADIAKFPFSQAKQLWTELKSGIDSVTTAAGKIKDVFGKIPWGSIGKGGKAALQGIADAATSIGGKLKDVGGKALDLASNIGKAAAAGAKSAWSGMISGLQAVGTAAKGAALAALDLSRKTLAAGLAALKSAGMWLAEKAALVGAAIAEKAAAIGEWLLNIALDANPIGLIIIAVLALVGVLIYCWTHFKTFRQVVEASLKAVAAVGEWLWKKALKPAFEEIAKITEWLWKSQIKPAFEGIAAAAKWLWNNGIEPAFHGIVHAAEWLWHQIEGAWHGITRVIDDGVHFISQLPGKIKGFFSGAASWLVSAGRDIINGLWNGISSMGSWIAGQISGLIQSVVPGPVLKILGINSPSKVFHEIGLGVTEGLVNGLVAGSPNAAQASSQMAHAVIGGASGLAVGGSGSLASLAAGAAASSYAANQGSGQPIIVQVDGKTLFQIMQTQALRYGRRNPTTGLVYTS